MIYNKLLPGAVVSRVIKVFLLFCYFSTALAASEKLAVDTAAFSSVIVYPEHMAPAVIYAEHDAILRSEQNSRVLSMDVVEGDKVSAGALLITFACSQEPFQLDALSAQRDMVSAQLEFSKWQQDQNKSLTAQNLSTVERDKSLATEVLVKTHELSMVEAQVSEARKRLKDCSIFAPFDGVIAQRDIGIGDLASPGAVLLSITDPKDVYVLADMQPQNSSMLENAEALAFIDRQGNYPIAFKEAIPTIDTLTGLQRVRLTFSTDSKPLPGTRGRIAWKTSVPYLPPRYLRQRNNELGFFTVEKDVVRFIPIHGAQEGQMAPVLVPVQTIIVNHLDRLIDGLQVDVVTDRD